MFFSHLYNIVAYGSFWTCLRLADLPQKISFFEVAKRLYLSI